MPPPPCLEPAHIFKMIPGTDIHLDHLWSRCVCVEGGRIRWAEDLQARDEGYVVSVRVCVCVYFKAR